jgi:hypothetical protein
MIISMLNVPRKGVQIFLDIKNNEAHPLDPASLIV